MILKDRLKRLIDGRKVKAALFHSFNFEPTFFENYVMPVLVPDGDFTNSEITNAVQWRRLYKDGAVPPITVYFDYDAKSRDSAPMLDYDWNAIHMPPVAKNKGNFHPKTSFLLVESGKLDELIVLVGSNNLTLGGWSDNLEAVAEIVLCPGKVFPDEFCRELHQLVYRTNELAGNRYLSPAEEMIDSFLNRREKTTDRHMRLFQSYTQSFLSFLDREVFERDTVAQVEILSPFIKKGTELVNQLISRGLKVNLQLPIFADSCTLDKTVVDAYADQGVRWHRPEDSFRNNHAKVYRFFGEKYMTTIVGSVNFTKPAWEEWNPKSISNVECAVLFREPRQKQQSILGPRASLDSLQFLTPGSDPEESFVRVAAPELIFTFDWLNRTIRWSGKTLRPCTLVLSDSLRFALKKNEFDLREQPEDFFRALARKSMVEVEEKWPDHVQKHDYYLQQEHFEQRPMPVRFSASDIAEYWDQIEKADTELREWLVSRMERIEDMIQDESGRLVADRTENRSLLNDMARHFHSLVQLERYLFKENIQDLPKHRRKAHCRDIGYYLTAENVETMASYRKEIRAAYERKEMLPAFYWILLKIIETQFFDHSRLLRLTKDMNRRKVFLETARLQREEIARELRTVASSLDLDRKKLDWATAVLRGQYAAS